MLALLASAVALLSGGSRPQAQACGSNAIVCENALTGNPSTEWDIVGSGDSTIQGFATDISVNKGGIVHFKVSTTASQFKIDIYRLGYYSGLGARKVATITGIAGKNQAACLTNTTTFIVDCGNWTESTTWTVPATAVSGVYIAKLTRTDTGGASHVVFIVRDDSSTSDILFQTSDTTWEAYNQYGGYSVYLGSPSRAFKVSYNRPFATRGQTPGYGPSNWVFYGEYPMIRWLEANGYDVSYFAGVDTARSGALIRNHKAFFSVAHDEYWSAEMRGNVEAARNAGIHIGFFSGNEIFWKTRWEASIDGSATAWRTLVTYKETWDNRQTDPADPPTWTGTWRDPRFSPPADGNNPENALTGQLFTVNRGSGQIVVPSKYSALRFWRNTAIANLAPGQSVTLATNTLGYEWDEDKDNGSRPAGSFQMSETTLPATDHLVDWGNTYVSEPATHHLTLYRHPSGALVFGAGTVQWTWGLDPTHDSSPDTGASTPDPNIQQATMNLLADMGIQPLTRQPGLVPAFASTDTTPPTSAVTSLTNGAVVPAATRITISGTASDSGGGVVAGVEVSTDSGATWRRATGTTNWSYSWRPGVGGAVTVMSRAVDDTGNLESPTTGVAVTVGPANCPCTIWDDTVIPWQLDSADANAVEEGLRFRSDVNGTVTGVRFYKTSTNTGTHTGHLWTNTGTLLASTTFTGETASGWQTANFSPAVPITAGTSYVISYHTNTGHYSVDDFYFGRSGVDMGPLHALADGVDGPNGLYTYSAGTIFPGLGFESENTWVDVVLGPVDTTPPTVSVTAPAAGSLLTGNVTITASAGDNVGVAGVQFKIDGGNLGAEDTAAPYSIVWNTTTASNATHVITAVARDGSANTTTSAPISVTVNNPDTTPPTVTMTAPLAGAIVGGTSVRVSASATDNNGVVGVQFLLDGANLNSEFTAAPYQFQWDASSIANGTHTLAARARDAAGNTATSPTVSFSVQNGVPLVDALVFTDRSTKATTIASPAFSTTSPNELILAFVAADDTGSGGNTVSGIASTGLTWTFIRRTNTNRGLSEIWRAFAATPVTNVTATATITQSAAASITIASFTNVDSSGTNGSGAIGATGSGTGASGAPTASLTTTRAKSIVIGIGNDWDTATARTVPANQTMVHQYLATVGDTFWVQRVTLASTASGVVTTINDTAPTADHYNLTTVEVLAPATPTFSVTGTVTPAASGSGTTLTLSGAGTGTATADSTGTFTFSGLANGTYTITPSKIGFTFSPASQTVTVNGANITSGVSFTATAVPTFSVSGNVSPSGSGTTMTLSGGATGTVTTDPSGNFTFSNLVNGTYTITPSKTGFTFTPASQTVTVSGANVIGVNFTANALPTFSVSGTVSPIANGTGTTLTLSGPASGTATADASGNFTFSGLANGTYTVTPSKTGFVFTPANASVTVTGANVTGVNFTIAAAPNLTIDANVSKDLATAATTVATPAFSTTAGNELLLAFVMTDYLSGANTTVTGVTGAGLTWQLVGRTNVQSGSSEIWRAFATAALSNVTVTASLSQSVVSTITVMSFTGVDTTGTNGSGAIGAVASTNSAGGAPTASVVTTRNNSWVVGVGNDYDNATARTVGAGQTLVHQYLTPLGDTYWVQRQTSTTPTAGTTVTINDTAPTGDRYNLMICEILPAPGS